MSQPHLDADGKSRGASIFYFCVPFTPLWNSARDPKAQTIGSPAVYPGQGSPTPQRQGPVVKELTLPVSPVHPQRKTDRDKNPSLRDRRERVRQDNPPVIWDVEGRSHSAERVWLVSCKAQRNLNNRCLNNLPCKPMVQ